MVVLNALGSVFSIVLMISAGCFLSHKGWFDEKTTKLFSKLVCNLAIPCLMISQFTESFDKDKLLNLSGGLFAPFISMAIGYLVAVIISKIIKVKKGRIGIIGTRGTILSGSYEKAIKDLGKNFVVYSKPTPLLVPFIEEGEIESNLIKDLIKEELQFFKTQKVDTLILGCTHYPIVCDLIAKTLPGVNLVNPGVELAIELKEYLVKNNLTSKVKKPKISFCVTDLNPRFTEVASMFLGETIKDKVTKVEVE